MNQHYKELLILARSVITHSVGSGDLSYYEELKERSEPIFHQNRGVFVTLTTEGGRLRGCIGNLIGFERVVDQVARLAYEAAFRDPRFDGVTKEELADLHIEISLLTEAKPITSYRDIRFGIDGIILLNTHHRAVFLPHVGQAQGWDLETTLQHLSLKAGLSANAYQDPATHFEVFQAEVFSEGEA